MKVKGSYFSYLGFTQDLPSIKRPEFVEYDLSDSLFSLIWFPLWDFLMDLAIIDR